MDVARRERSFLRVAGPEAGDYLQRMVSNDVGALGVGASCPALLLSPKGRVLAPLIVLRRGEDDYLLLTEPELGETVRTLLRRMRLRSRCEVEPEEHDSALVFGGVDGIPGDVAGAVEVLDAGLESTLADEELEVRRIEAAAPRWGHEIDDRTLPAEAGLDRTHVSFTKGCYPGQEPVARLHYRGHPNRGLRVLELAERPCRDAEVVHQGRPVGRVTSAARRPDGSVVALAYVRAEVPEDAHLDTAAHAAT